MLTIRGIGKYRGVHASEIFSDDDCGVILETRDYPLLCLYQDGESTPVSDLMGMENHIFTVVPKAAVQGEIDWPACASPACAPRAGKHADRRLPVFEAGRYLIAFDGLPAALRRRQARPCSSWRCIIGAGTVTPDGRG